MISERSGPPRSHRIYSSKPCQMHGFERGFPQFRRIFLGQFTRHKSRAQSGANPPRFSRKNLPQKRAENYASDARRDATKSLRKILGNAKAVYATFAFPLP